MKKANGDCLRGEGGQQGEGWLLAMEDQELEQEKYSSQRRPRSSSAESSGTAKDISRIQRFLLTSQNILSD